ncbi:hypothetical protein CC78DRAFT_612034 [Lojkania enalia]|uniref:Uncharacterized protein n=1 Tax=Lojkania enalia TaxID=147567 RepID=A0A9P4NAJ5_9PLEO|nr:hypothetical protein CC78DRAFT_612034 [Didymosphaeria enalia]
MAAGKASNKQSKGALGAKGGRRAGCTLGPPPQCTPGGIRRTKDQHCSLPNRVYFFPCVAREGGAETGIKEQAPIDGWHVYLEWAAVVFSLRWLGAPLSACRPSAESSQTNLLFATAESERLTTSDCRRRRVNANVWNRFCSGKAKRIRYSLASRFALSSFTLCYTLLYII